MWRRRIGYLLVLAGVMAGLTAVGVRSGNRTTESVEAAAAAPVTTVVVDAGHGGEDGGATSVTGVPESRLNLEIALRADDFLALLGIPTRMVREEDTAIYDPSAETLSQKKVSDLHNRAALVNGVPGALLLSIHQNTFPDGQYHGAQVFYARTDGSRRLAETVQQALTAVDPDNRRQPKASDAVYLLNHIQCAGILVECGFLSNEAEERLLREPDYQTKLVLAIGTALNGWICEERDSLEV